MTPTYTIHLYSQLIINALNHHSSVPFQVFHLLQDVRRYFQTFAQVQVQHVIEIIYLNTVILLL